MSDFKAKMYQIQFRLDDRLSRFDTIPACDGQTYGQTDRRTDVQPIAIACAG